MANKLYEESAIQDIAIAIREKNGSEDTYTVSQMGDAIRSIPGGDDALLKDIIQRTVTEITIPEGVTKIGNYVFYNYSVLKTVIIPDSVTELASGVFRGCVNLELTEIPSNITTIGLYTFGNCRKITELTFKGTPTFLNSNIFENSQTLAVINVPWAEGEVANAPWGAVNATINYNYMESGAE